MKNNGEKHVFVWHVTGISEATKTWTVLGNHDKFLTDRNMMIVRLYTSNYIHQYSSAISITAWYLHQIRFKKSFVTTNQDSRPRVAPKQIWWMSHQH